MAWGPSMVSTAWLPWMSALLWVCVLVFILYPREGINIGIGASY